MPHSSLAALVDKLSTSPRVKGVFLTGTTATRLTPSSDIDLVVVLDKNNEEIKSVYTIIEERFSDVFFFDTEFLRQLQGKTEVSANAFDGMFVEWLGKGKIVYDPEGILTTLQVNIHAAPPAQMVDETEKRDLWIKVNYNAIANARYYRSQDEIYHKALELRLLYSVIELITAYFSFRDLPWRGEKAAIRYLEQKDQAFLHLFESYSKSSSLEERMRWYTALFQATCVGEYQPWEEDFVVALSHRKGYDEDLEKFWNELVG